MNGSISLLRWGGGRILVSTRKNIVLYFHEIVPKELIDYKFFCFNGTPKYVQVIQNRNIHETIDFFDLQWNHQNFIGLTPNIKNAEYMPLLPKDVLNKMIYIAKQLSQSIPFLRVDMYYIKGKIYFGETTFFPASGLGSFTPQEWNYKLGKMIN